MDRSREVQVKTARRGVAIAVSAAAVLAVAVLVPGGAGAAPAAPAAPALSKTIQVVATGLHAPRGVFYDAAQHRVLAAEAGDWFLAPSGYTPCGNAERGLPFCLGHSGSVLQYSEANGSAQRIITGLPSASLQIDGLPVVIGLHDLTMAPGDSDLIAVFGTLGNKAYRTSLGPGGALLGQAVRFTGSGKAKPFADLLSFINTIYPDMEADPYGVIAGPYGTMVANAGGHFIRDANGNIISEGNDLLNVSPTGTISEVAQFPAHPLIADPSTIINTVPTSVVQGPDGAFYVGELSGAAAWAYPGEARIWRVVPGQPPAIYATGFHTIVDLRFDSQGRLIVLETSPDPFDTTGEGELLRLEPDGTRTSLFGPGDGVLNPGGVALVNDNTFYVTSEIASCCSIGKLLKITVTG
jgi:hypothetical protein